MLNLQHSWTVLKSLQNLHCQNKKSSSLTKWLCGSMLINGKFFVHGIHSVTPQLHGVGNACGCAPWVHSVLIPNFGPMASYRQSSSRFPMRTSKNAVARCFGVICQWCTEHRTTGGSSGCYLLKEPVHKILQKSNQQKDVEVRKCLQNTASQWTWNSWNFHPTCEGDTLLPESLSTKSRIRSSSSDKDCLQENKISTSETLFVKTGLWYGKLSTHKGTKHWKRFFKVSELSFQTEPQQGVHVPCIIHSTFQPRMRASDSMQNSQTTNDVSVCKCMSMYWIYKNVWILKCDQNRSWFPALSANAPSIIKLHVYPPERKTLHLCS